MCSPKKSESAHTFARQAIPMIWDFAEGKSIQSESCRQFASAARLDSAGSSKRSLPHAAGQRSQAMRHRRQLRLVASWQPIRHTTTTSDMQISPTSSMCGCGDRSASIYPRSARHDAYAQRPMNSSQIRSGTKEGARSSSRTASRDVFARICEGTPADFPITVFYAFKQAETDDDGGHASTGWETLLEGMLTSGWAVTATWPIRTERGGRMRDIGVERTCVIHRPRLPPPTRRRRLHRPARTDQRSARRVP